MKFSRIFITLLLLLAFISMVPASATGTAATARDPWDFCIKLGDYYDSEHNGHHVIYCTTFSTGEEGWYYIPHGEDFQIVRVG